MEKQLKSNQRKRKKVCLNTSNKNRKSLFFLFLVQKEIEKTNKREKA